MIRVPIDLPLDAELYELEEQAAEASLAEAKVLGADHGVVVEGRTVRARRSARRSSRRPQRRAGPT